MRLCDPPRPASLCYKLECHRDSTLHVEGLHAWSGMEAEGETADAAAIRERLQALVGELKSIKGNLLTSPGASADGAAPSEDGGTANNNFGGGRSTSGTRSSKFAFDLGEDLTLLEPSPAAVAEAAAQASQWRSKAVDALRRELPAGDDHHDRGLVEPGKQSSNSHSQLHSASPSSTTTTTSSLTFPSSSFSSSSPSASRAGSDEGESAELQSDIKRLRGRLRGLTSKVDAAQAHQAELARQEAIHKQKLVEVSKSQAVRRALTCVHCRDQGYYEFNRFVCWLCVRVVFTHSQLIHSAPCVTFVRTCACGCTMGHHTTPW